jgi:hypothetical protein
MAFIVEQFVGDKGIQLGYEDVIRPFAFGTDWTRVRVGMRYALNGTQAIVPTSVKVGFCVGNQASISNIATSAIWVRSEGNASSITYGGTTPNFFYDTTTAVTGFFYERVGATTSNLSNPSQSRSAFSANPTALRSIMMLDVTKNAGATTITANYYYLTNVQVVTDWTRSAFIAAMANDGTPTGTTTWSQPITVSRTQRDWNSMFVGWTRITPAMCVYDMAVARYT